MLKISVRNSSLKRSVSCIFLKIEKSMRLKVGPANWSGAPPKCVQGTGSSRARSRLRERFRISEETQFAV